MLVAVAATVMLALRPQAGPATPGEAGGEVERTGASGEPVGPTPGSDVSEPVGSGDVEVAPAPSVVRVWALPDLPPGFEDQVAELPHVLEVATTRRGLVHLGASWDADGVPVDKLPDGFVIPMQAVAVDIGRPSLPEELASLDAGVVALSATAARLRGVGTGGVLELDGRRFDLAAVVDDRDAGSAEVLVALEDADHFGFGRRSVTIRHEGDDDELAEAIAALLPDDVAARIRLPRDDATGPIVRGHIAMKERFGEFAHGPVGSGGGFRQDSAWVEANITTVRVPILGSITCHRDFIPLVAGALGELEDAGLSHLVDPSDYAGCWTPRRIASGRSISKHAWGAAIDLNARTNAYGDVPTLDPRVVEVFRRWGMAWGGDFLVPDGMHFEWYEDPEHVATDEG